VSKLNIEDVLRYIKEADDAKAMEALQAIMSYTKAQTTGYVAEMLEGAENIDVDIRAMKEVASVSVPMAYQLLDVMLNGEVELPDNVVMFPGNNTAH
jgi:hypothetical protein